MTAPQKPNKLDYWVVGIAIGAVIGFGACVALVYVGAPYLFSCMELGQ